jgi:hypothetical protein
MKEPSNLKKGKPRNQSWSLVLKGKGPYDKHGDKKKAWIERETKRLVKDEKKEPEKARAIAKVKWERMFGKFKKSQGETTMLKAKFTRKVPDGKGGWRYEYASGAFHGQPLRLGHGGDKTHELHSAAQDASKKARESGSSKDHAVAAGAHKRTRKHIDNMIEHSKKEAKTNPLPYLQEQHKDRLVAYDEMKTHHEAALKHHVEAETKGKSMMLKANKIKLVGNRYVYGDHPEGDEAEGRPDVHQEAESSSQGAVWSSKEAYRQTGQTNYTRESDEPEQDSHRSALQHKEAEHAHINAARAHVKAYEANKECAKLKGVDAELKERYKGNAEQHMHHAKLHTSLAKKHHAHSGGHLKAAKRQEARTGTEG